MIELEHITAGYGSSDVISDFSLTIPAGSITVILGRNGRGKTTLLRCLSGALPYQGAITFGGRDIRDMRPRERARCFGIMPQILPGPAISVRELVSYGRQPYLGFLGTLSPSDWRQVDRAMEAAGISALSHRLVSSLSGGERQRAYFALLLAQDPQVLLLDEPGSYLDADAAKQLYQFLEMERGNGKTVVAVVHDVNRALELADRLVVLDAEPFIGTPAEFLARDIPQTVFGLRRYDGSDEDGQPATFFR